MDGSAQLYETRRGPVGALVVRVVLALALAGVALAGPLRVADRSVLPALDARDAGAKAIRPQPQLAVRGPTGSVRLASSSGPEPIHLRTFRAALGTDVQSAPAPALRNAGTSGYLQQRAQGPRGPPPALA